MRQFTIDKAKIAALYIWPGNDFHRMSNCYVLQLCFTIAKLLIRTQLELLS